MRDFDKALEFAEIAFKNIPVSEKYKYSAADEKFAYVKHYVDLNLMKLYMLRGEAFEKETYDFFMDKMASYNFEKSGKTFGKELGRKFYQPDGKYLNHSTLCAYFYFKGFGVEQDIDFAKDIIKWVGKTNNWRDVYIQKYYIKDFEFVKFLIEEDSNIIVNNHFLY
ncbi:MAG: hypothetical protein R3Y46_06780 [Opitutales bacterium]